MNAIVHNKQTYAYFVLAWRSSHAASHHSNEGEWKHSFVLEKQGRKNSREFHSLPLEGMESFLHFCILINFLMKQITLSVNRSKRLGYNIRYLGDNY